MKVNADEFFFLLGVGMVFLGAGLDFFSSHSLASTICLGIGGTLLVVSKILGKD